MKHEILLVAVAAFVTALTRFLPFFVFGEKRKTPEFILRMGKVLPLAFMGMLVVYCLKDVPILEYPYGIPELLGCTSVTLLHIWKRSSLLSIGGGTAVYMLLVQWVF